MSPVEVSREIEAARLRRIDEMNRDIHLAWRVQQMKVLTKRSKQGKVTLPKLEKFLIPDREKKRQTVNEMHAVLKTLSLRSGIPLRKPRATRGE